MSERGKFRTAADILTRLAFAGLCLFLVSVVLLNVGFEGEVGAFFETGWHLLTGFAFFLRRNLAAISTDAGTWGPGVVAFGLALGIGHYFLRGWARKRDRSWSLFSSLCAGLVLPVLFVIAFLVPGVFVQLEGLGRATWFQHGHGPRPWVRHQTELVARAARSWSQMQNQWKYPDSLDVLVKAELIGADILKPLKIDESEPAEPLMYFGKDVARGADPSLPLVISPCFTMNGVRMRVVATIGGESLTIRDEELDAWIDKAMAARKP